MKKLLMFLLLVCLMPIVVSAASFIFQKDAPIDVHISCLDINNSYCTSDTLCQASIYYPNQTILISNISMDYNNVYYNISFNESELSVIGEYSAIISCQGDANGISTFNFEVTYNGKEKPSGIVIVFFCVAFLIVIGTLSYFLIYNIGHLGQMDYDLGDLIKNVSVYFVLVGLYILSTFYMGDQLIDTILVWVIGITGFTNVAMSFLFFIICFLAKRKTTMENAW
jgi:hypothetical protein